LAKNLEYDDRWIRSLVQGEFAGFSLGEDAALWHPNEIEIKHFSRRRQTSRGAGLRGNHSEALLVEAVAAASAIDSPFAGPR